MHATKLTASLIVPLLALGLTFTAFADVQPVLGNAVPVSVGEKVFGIIVYPTGMYTVGKVQVVGSVSDDMFSYWEGSYKGDYYYYDPYSNRWMSGPVSYRHATLAFNGESVEGWVRDFGGLPDYNHFFGNDGDLYKRINVFKRNRGDRKIKTRIVYTYFRNLRTGERSDGGKFPHIQVTGATVEYINQESRRQEDNIQLLLDAVPSLADWREAAQTLPEKVDAPQTLPKTEDPSLAQLITKELGPLIVGPQQPKN
jgi:hypothetical protein